MADPLDLTGDIASAIDGAALRNATLAVAYVRDDGSPSVSFRGSTQVHGATELALWARKRDSGLASGSSTAPAFRSSITAVQGDRGRCFCRSRVGPGSRPSSTTRSTKR
jgi:hypothetical protein